MGMLEIHFLHPTLLTRSFFSPRTIKSPSTGRAVLSSKLVGPTSGRVVMVKTERREVPGSNLGRACRPSHSEFSVVLSETRVNKG